MTRALFTLNGFRRGARDGVPLAVSIFAYGLGFGLVAAQAGFGVGKAVATSAAIYSGSAQLAAVNLLQTGEATVWALFATILVINARYLLFGAALQPWLWSAGPLRAYGSLLLLGDANWLMTMRAIRAGEEDRAYLAGTGAPIAVGWLSGRCRRSPKTWPRARSSSSESRGLVRMALIAPPVESWCSRSSP